MDSEPNRVCSRLAELGFNAVSLAVRYIEERQGTPGPNLIFQNPRRRAYVSEGDVVYWNFDPTRYEALPSPLRPRKSKDIPGDPLQTFIRACEKNDLRKVVWLPVLRAEKVVQNFPEYGVQDIYDSPVGHRRAFLCPSHPEVQETFCLMVEELTEKYEFDELELDFIRYPEILSSDSPLLSLALSPCFCKHCWKKAEQQGIDLGEVAKELKTVVEWHVKWLGSSGHCEDRDYIEALYEELTRRILESKTIQHWLSFRARLVTDFVTQLVEIAHQRKEVRVTADLYPPSGSWRVGQDFTALSQNLEGVKLMLYIRPFGRSICRIPFETHLARTLLGDRMLVLGLASWPPTSPEDLHTQLLLAERTPVDGVSFYCFGWTPEENLAVINRFWKGEGK